MTNLRPPPPTGAPENLAKKTILCRNIVRNHGYQTNFEKSTFFKNLGKICANFVLQHHRRVSGKHRSWQFLVQNPLFLQSQARPQSNRSQNQCRCDKHGFSVVPEMHSTQPNELPPNHVEHTNLARERTSTFHTGMARNPYFCSAKMRWTPN